MTFISMARGRVLKEIISNQLYTFSGQSIEACLSRQYAGVDYKEDIIHTWIKVTFFHYIVRKI
jgi:hypothetical protein